MAIKDKDKVKIEYTGSFEDGSVFDTSVGKEPLDVVIGEGKVIKGFNDALIGMKKGEEKEIKLETEEAYGDYNPNLIKKIPKDQLPKEPEAKPNMVILVGLANGQQVPAIIKEVTETDITIDLNHPLAGKALNFKLKVIDIEK